MKCPYCGKDISDNSVYCTECGQALTNHQQSDNVDQYWDKVQKENEKAEIKRKEEIKKNEDEKKAKRGILFGVLAGCIAIAVMVIYATVIAPANKYDKAIVLYDDSNYEEARTLFAELGDYNDSAQWIDNCDLRLKEIAYNTAVTEFEEGDYSAALNDFRLLEDFQDSEHYVGECELIFAQSANVGDSVTFGHYGEDKSPIEWIVLERNDSDILLISAYYVTSKVANGDQSLEYSDDRDGHDYHCWSQSTLRRWLNNDFISESFSDGQIQALLTNDIVTDEYSVDDYEGGNEEEISVTTEDRVYIPSKYDVERYNLKPVPSMRYPDSSPMEGWLRDRGHGIAFQSTLDENGDYGSEWHFYSSYGIGPIIRLKLNYSEIVEQSEE